jgi:NAD(P)-dependent dehydrogenase (short-subunit alcohol dehydrogenase family)
MSINQMSINQMSINQKLAGKVAVVAGATRGAGRGIAVELGAAGATVYCTGRSVRGQVSPSHRPETINETADMVTAAGGTGIAIQTDHLVEEQVKALFERVAREQEGRLDILVNDIWGGEELTQWDVPFWEQDMTRGLHLLENAVYTHLLTSRWGVPLMAAQGSGLIIEVGDGTGYNYRGSLFYSLAKVSVIHAAEAMTADLDERGLSGIAALALTPGYLRSEWMLDHWGITENEWQEKAQTGGFQYGGTESPYYIGRAVAALASDPSIGAKKGKCLNTADLMKEYGFTDWDGRQPVFDWQPAFCRNCPAREPGTG